MALIDNLNALKTDFESYLSGFDTSTIKRSNFSLVEGYLRLLTLINTINNSSASTEVEILSATNTISSSGDTTVISAVAGKQIVITYLAIQNESANPTTIIYKKGSTPIGRVFGQNQGDGIAVPFDSNHEYKLPVNTAFVINLSGANTCGYTIFYYLK